MAGREQGALAEPVKQASQLVSERNSERNSERRRKRWRKGERDKAELIDCISHPART